MCIGRVICGLGVKVLPCAVGQFFARTGLVEILATDLMGRLPGLLSFGAV